MRITSQLHRPARLGKRHSHIVCRRIDSIDPKAVDRFHIYICIIPSRK